MSDFIKGNRYLNEDEMKNNAQLICDYLMGKGWSFNACVGIIANMQQESTMNPALWESFQTGNINGGYGLVQWTPSTKITNWLTSHGKQLDDGYGQLDKIIEEVTDGSQWIATSNYNLSFEDFTKSNDDVEYLTMAFQCNYERPAQIHDERKGFALKWKDTLNNSGGGDNPQKHDFCKLIFPYDFGRFNRIISKENKFKIIEVKTNTVVIEDINNNKNYMVLKRYIKRM